MLELIGDGALDPFAIPTPIVPWDQAAEVWLEPATKLVLNHT